MKKAMDIGKLNKRITFQKQAEVEDAMGQSTQAWEDVKTVWADFYPVRSGEYQEAEQKKREEITYKAKLRYIPDINAAMRIAFRGRYFLISNVINVDEGNYRLELECTEYIEKALDERMGKDGKGWK